MFYDYTVGDKAAFKEHESYRFYLPRAESVIQGWLFVYRRSLARRRPNTAGQGKEANLKLRALLFSETWDTVAATEKGFLQITGRKAAVDLYRDLIWSLIRNKLLGYPVAHSTSTWRLF